MRKYDKRKAGQLYLRKCLETGEHELFLFTYALYNANELTPGEMWVREFSGRGKPAPSQSAADFVIAALSSNSFKVDADTGRAVLKLLGSEFPDASNRLKLALIRHQKMPKPLPQVHLKSSSHDNILSVAKPSSSPRPWGVSSAGSSGSGVIKDSSIELSESSSHNLLSVAKPKDIARFIVSKDMQLFLDIDTWELLNPQLSLNSVVEWFNRVGFCVVYSILQDAETKKSRQGRIRTWIKVLRHIKQLGDYNGYAAVLAGLHNMALQRLPCWEDLGTSLEAEMAELDEVMNPSGNYQQYRKLLVEQTYASIVPFMGVLSRDITLLLEGNELYTSEGYPNFELTRMLYALLKEVERRQRVLLTDPKTLRFRLPTSSDMLEHSMPTNTDVQSLYDMSSKIKPLPPHVAAALMEEAKADVKEEVDQPSTPFMVVSIWNVSTYLWSAEQVGEWLRWVDLGSHASTFVEEEICGEDLFELSRSDIEYLGITKVGDRLRLLKMIEKLKRMTDTRYGPTSAFAF